MGAKTKVVQMDESRFLLELKSVSFLCLDKLMNSLCVETISFLSMFSSDPLFSCTVTFCILVFLYLPPLFRKIVFSPVLILTGILLLTILRLGAIQKSQHEQKETQIKPEPIIVEEEKNRASKCREEKQSEEKETESPEQVNQWSNSEIELNTQMGSCFVEWNVRAPLEVIYEEYEGEETGDECPNEREENWDMGVLRYPSLSRYYPESDSDSSSESEFPARGDRDSPEDVCFRWDEENREGLIEIALDGSKMKRDFEFHFEEENLIEIDISPTRNRELSGDHVALSGEISCN